MPDNYTGRRATDITGAIAALDALVSEESVARGLQFRPRPTDVVISPFGKSGTTWLQQIAHALRTRGDEDFDDISRVVPWIETAHDLGIDLDAPQKAEPRLFKSHLSRDRVPEGARYIVSFRDPRDALVSFYRFLEGWLFEPGAVDIAAFAEGMYLDRGGRRDYWTHLASWWVRRDEDDVLLLAYELMKEDLPGAVREIAGFMDIELDDALEALVLHQASLPYMLENKHRYDDRLMRELSERRLGLPPGSDSAKVRKGEVGSHRYELPESVVEALDDTWRDEIETRFGLADYPALVDALRRRGGS